MKNTFIYPTQKNTLYMLIFWQLFPLFIMAIGNKIGPFGWFCFELVICSILCLWKYKPIKEMDEREKAIELKWRSRMFDWSYSMIMIPIVIVSLRPETSAWHVLMSFVIPSTLSNTAMSIGLRREMGSFFYPEELVATKNERHSSQN